MKFLLTLLLLQTTLTYAADTTARIRVMTSNLTTGDQNYTGGEGIRIMKGLKADVILMQEFNYKTNSDKDIREMVDSVGEGFHYYREKEEDRNIPNGIISRYPILDSGEWEDENIQDRDFAYARIDIPGDRELFAISVHLKASEGSQNAARRMKQTKALKKFISDNMFDVKNKPAIIHWNDYVVIGGDFNLTVRDDEVIKEFAKDKIDDGTKTYALSEDGAPTDSQGRTTTNMNGKKNYDWILASDDLKKLLVPVQFLGSAEERAEELVNTFKFGLVFDSTTFPKLERTGGIHAEDSRGNSMQHLAVVKDFQVPVKKNPEEDAETEVGECDWYQWGCW